MSHNSSYGAEKLPAANIPPKGPYYLARPHFPQIQPSDLYARVRPQPQPPAFYVPVQPQPVAFYAPAWPQPQPEAFHAPVWPHPPHPSQIQPPALYAPALPYPQQGWYSRPLLLPGCYLPAWPKAQYGNVGHFQPSAPFVPTSPDTGTGASELTVVDSSAASSYVPALPDTQLRFGNKKEGIDFYKDWAIGNGYAVSIGRGSDERRVRLCCSRANRPFSGPSQGIRLKSTSKRRNCPYRLTLRCDSVGLWRIVLTNGTHNHGRIPTKEMASLAQARARSLKPYLDSIKLDVFRCKPKVLMETLREKHKDILVIAKDLINYRAKLLKERQSGLRSRRSSTSSPKTTSRTSESAVARLSKDTGPRIHLRKETSSHECGGTLA